MADVKTSALPALSGPVSGSDLLAVVDVSDVSSAATGKTKKVTVVGFLKGAGIHSVKAYGAVGDGVTDDGAAIVAAIAAVAAAGGGEVLFPPGRYVSSVKFAVPAGVFLVGAGVGEWDIVFHDRDKTWTGTSILFTGTGATVESFTGVTSLELGGGWAEDPDTPGTYFKLLSFMNTDASGATPATAAAFSAAVTLASGSGMSGIRICPFMGSDGYTDYSDEGMSSLGADWDVGLLLQDAENCRVENVQSVGYWRMAGCAIVSPGMATSGKSERNYFQNCKFQGYRGLAVRAGDTWEVSGTTASTIDITATDEHYWPASGTVEGIQGGLYTYTGTSESAGTLTFTGVTPDPNAAGETVVRNPNRGSGFAGCEFHDCFIHGLDHVSGDDAETMGFADASAALEMSGFPLRGVQFYNCKAQTDERVIAHFHDVDDCQWFGGQFEGGGDRFMIASPIESSSTATAPSGQTYNLRFTSVLLSTGADLRLFNPRSIHDDMRQINPKERGSADMHIEPLAGQNLRIRNAPSQSTYLTTSDGTDRWRFSESGSLFPSTSGGASLGTTANRCAIVAANLLNMNPYTVATVPSAASNTNAHIRVTDGNGGRACVAVSDGTNWRRTHDGQVISTTIGSHNNATSGGGNPTLSVAPETAAAFASLADAGARSYDYDPGADGYFTIYYEFRLITGGGAYRKVLATQDFKRVSGVCSLEGSAVINALGVQTGVAVAFSIVSDDVRVTLTNTTGATLTGHYWRGTLAGDLPV